MLEYQQRQIQTKEGVSMVTDANLGEFVEYYDDGGRYGFLMSVNVYGKPRKTSTKKKVKKGTNTTVTVQEDDDNTTAGTGTIRPYSTNHGHGDKTVDIALEKIYPVDPAYKKKVAEQEAALKKEILGTIPPLVALFG
jgi:hypothetical protein